MIPGTRAPQSRVAAAVFQLLFLPDPPDLAGKRRYRYRYGGDKLRQPEVKRQLARAYAGHAFMAAQEARGREESCIMTVRRG
jgi:hypothetical protein